MRMENETECIVQHEVSKRFRGCKAWSSKGEEKRNGNQSRQSLNRALLATFSPSTFMHTPCLVSPPPSSPTEPSLLVETVFSNASPPLQPRRIIAVPSCVKISLARLEIYFTAVFEGRRDASFLFLFFWKRL